MSRGGVDLAVVGCGIVGAATAEALSRLAPGATLALLDKEPAPARHQSGRNSGVVHSGLYYRLGSRKARYSLDGGARLARFCAEHGLPLRRTGKLVVATAEDQLAGLHELARRGAGHGLAVELLDPAGVRLREPAVRALAGLHVPSTALADFPAVTRRLAELAAGRGARLLLGTAVHRIETRGSGAVLHTSAGPIPAGHVVVCAGLHGDRLAPGAARELGVRIVPFRGEYLHLARPELVRGLIYPVPDPALPFLGVHLTRGLDGMVHAGPNAVLATAREGYRRTDVDLRELAGTLGWPGSWRMARRFWRTGAAELARSLSLAAAARHLQRMLPQLRAADLRRDGAGVRAQAVLRDGTLADDFLIHRDGPLTAVLNAPSPAATAALCLGEELAELALRP